MAILQPFTMEQPATETPETTETTTGSEGEDKTEGGETETTTE